MLREGAFRISALSFLLPPFCGLGNKRWNFNHFGKCSSLRWPAPSLQPTSLNHSYLVWVWASNLGSSTLNRRRSPAVQKFCVVYIDRSGETSWLFPLGQAWVVVISQLVKGCGKLWEQGVTELNTLSKTFLTGHLVLWGCLLVLKRWACPGVHAVLFLGVDPGWFENRIESLIQFLLRSLNIVLTLK